ncbi:hypothetical protein Gotur_033002 [Gossypium turneri]
MAMRKVYSEIKGMKVKEVPNYVKPMLSMDYVKKAFQKGLDNYNSKHIQTDSIQPLYHVCFGGMVFSYLVALPNERRHLEHQQHSKEHEEKQNKQFQIVASETCIDSRRAESELDSEEDLEELESDVKKTVERSWEIGEMKLGKSDSDLGKNEIGEI